MKAIIKVKNLPDAPTPSKRYRKSWEGENPVPVSKINPYKLVSPATRQKRIRDSLAPGKSSGDRYPHGHTWTEEETEKLIELYKTGMVYSAMPDVLEISFSAIKHKIELLQKKGVIEYREKTKRMYRR